MVGETVAHGWPGPIGDIEFAIGHRYAVGCHARAGFPGHAFVGPAQLHEFVVAIKDNVELRILPAGHMDLIGDGVLCGRLPFDVNGTDPGEFSIPFGIHQPGVCTTCCGPYDPCLSIVPEGFDAGVGAYDVSEFFAVGIGEAIEDLSVGIDDADAIAVFDGGQVRAFNAADVQGVIFYRRVAESNHLSGAADDPVIGHEYRCRVEH